MKVTVPPGCTGVELPNGQKLNANRSGHVTIDDPHVAAYAKKSVHGQSGLLGKGLIGFRGLGSPSRFCPSCGFEGFAWQTECPRCKTAMSDVQKEST